MKKMLQDMKSSFELHTKDVNTGNDAITKFAISNESMDEGEKQLAEQSTISLESAVSNVMTSIASSEDYDASITHAQETAALKIAALAANPVIGLKALNKLKPVAGATDNNTLSVESIGVTDAITGEDANKAISLSVEAFDGQQVTNSLFLSIATNFAASKQDEFGEAFFPTITIDPLVSGVTIETEVVNIIVKDYERKLSGDASKIRNNKVPLVKALYNSELLTNNRNMIVPVYREDEGQDDKLLTKFKFQSESNGDKVITAPYKMGVEIDVLGISQTDAMVAKGMSDETDALDRTVKMRRVYFELTGKDSDGNEVTETFYKDISIFAGSSFTYTPEDHHKDIALNFKTTDIRFTIGKVKTAKGQDSKIFKALETEFMDYEVKMGMILHGDGNTEFGTITVYGSNTSFQGVVDGNGDGVAPTETLYTTAKSIIGTAKLVGYTLDAYRTNSNFRTSGLRYGVENFKDIINVPLRGGISAINAINNATGNDNDTAKLAAHIQAIGLTTSVEAVNRLLNHVEVLRNITNGNGVSDVKLAGIGRYHVNTYFADLELDLSTAVDSIKSTERIADIKAAMVNFIKSVVLDMYLESNYAAAYTNATKGLGKKPTVLIGTDPKNKSYLTSGDGKVDLGEDFADVKVVSTPNGGVAGNLYITFIIDDESKNTKVNPFNFGNMFWAPTITTDVVKTDGKVIRELHNIPRYLHHVNLPIMSVIKVTGLQSTLGKVVSFMKQAQA